MMGLIALSFLVLPGTNNEKLRYSTDMFGIKKKMLDILRRAVAMMNKCRRARVVPNKTFKIKS
jgi:hypothetical protein